MKTKWRDACECIYTPGEAKKICEAQGTEFDQYNEVVVSLFGGEGSIPAAEWIASVGGRAIGKDHPWGVYTYFAFPLALIEQAPEMRMIGGGSHLCTFSPDGSKYLSWQF